MTRAEAKKLYYMYDLEPWYLAMLEREREKKFSLAVFSDKTVMKLCFEKFYSEVKDTTFDDWLNHVEDRHNSAT
jgi:glutamate synthase domain-containing protein 2